MLTIPLEKPAYIITKAPEFDVELPTVDESSESNPSDDAESDALEAARTIRSIRSWSMRSIH